MFVQNYGNLSARKPVQYFGSPSKGDGEVRVAMDSDDGEKVSMTLSRREVTDFILELLEAQDVNGGEEITFRIPHKLPVDGVYVGKFAGAGEPRVASVVGGKVLVVVDGSKIVDRTEAYKLGDLTLVPAEVVL